MTSTPRISRLVLHLTMALLAIFFLAPASRAAIFNVTNTNDFGAGSLRQAMLDANASPAADTILITATGTITLQTELPHIDGSVQLLGLGADRLTVRRSSTAAGFRIFTILESSALVNISGLEISNGRANSPGEVGGGIRSVADLTLNQCIVSDNTAGRVGGGISMDGGRLIVDRCSIINNSAQRGGGIDAVGSGFDGFISRSTISGNTAQSGAGISLKNLDVGAADLCVRSSTISGNHDGSLGGGIRLEAQNGIAGCFLENSIVGGNDGPELITVGVNAGLFDFGNNLIEENSGVSSSFGAGLPNSNGSFVGTVSSPVDPLLLPLSNHGGPSPTHALKCDSLAVDNGMAFAMDQRGLPTCLDGDGDGIAQDDIGAFERQRYPVNTLADSGPGSLRQAILDNNDAGVGLIDIEEAGTIGLTAPLPTLSRDVKIKGLGASCSEIRPIQAESFGIMVVGDLVRATISDLTMSTGGNVPEGGAILSLGGDLTVESCVLSQNSAFLQAGGIAVVGGTLVLKDSAIVDNRARGVSVTSNGSATVTNTTISGNQNKGIFAFESQVEVLNSTVTNNVDGIICNSGSLTLGNTIVAGNDGLEDVDGFQSTFMTLGGNLIGKWSSGAPFPAGLPNVNSDYVGTIPSPLDAGLRPLSNYGGPTPTHALELGSLAIDHGLGSPSTLPATDQRGRPRLRDGSCVGAELVDIGAVEHEECRGGNVNAGGGSVVFSDDMENGDGNFTTSSPTGNNEWRIALTPIPCDAVHAFYCDDLAETQDNYLDTLPIQLPNGPSVLKFNHAYDTEFGGGNIGYDGAVIEASLDGGA